ncbi:preprotein translocase subunit SecY [Candidatus Tachikawaea gelatinosa]|uniref:Protein translocase subunit SecY n=1 Tax=Candidatus Tachikawaea gelatinosa TaxID=1410383 RepID=A0A090ARF6_9ENTR|nr:preprotein translocase subunit SecY [Candidatus Tachikawaea gelatinosa]BAP58355.1 protein translocase subunit SecY [Candidatus Tachikawaea gelatinosa]
MTDHQIKSNFYNKKSSFDNLKYRLLFLITALIIFRIGSFIPIPGINTVVLAKIIEQQRGTIIEMFNMFSGGALSHASIFTLGIMPHISASIIIQLLTMLHPKFSDIRKEGESGQKKINQYIRYTTLIISIFQAIGIATGLPNIPGMEELVVDVNFSFYFVAVVSLVTGTVFLMWLGEQISEKGIGNGISIIIFIGIVAGLPRAIAHTIEQSRQGNLPIMLLMLVIGFILITTYFVVFIERGQRKICVNYAKRQHGRKLYAVQNTHLPLKVNMSGVIPAIFASSIILFPATIVSWFGKRSSWTWLHVVQSYLQPGQPFYLLLYASAIIFFCFFYTSIVFKPRDTADNLKKSGAFIPGIRPGEKTAKYINIIMKKITLIGAVYITFICLIPELIRYIANVPFYFGGTSLLIVVVVIIDFISQLQSILISNQYESLLKKANFKGYHH